MANESKKADDQEKEYTVCDKDNDGYEIDTYPTKEAAEQRVQTLSAQGARPDRYEVKEGAKGDHEKKKKEEAAKAEKGQKEDKGDKSKDKGHAEAPTQGPKRY